MPEFTVINFSSDSSNQDVKVAGNFTNWQPEEMKYNDLAHRYEYKIDSLIDGSKNGKYNFKFVVNGDWRTDQNYSSEFDPSGNENNVVLYDYTTDRRASDEYVNKVKDEVTHDNEEEPSTPDPTPYNLSAQTTNVPVTSTTNAATVAAAGIIPLTEAPDVNSITAQDRKTDNDITTASKAIPQTEAIKKEEKIPPTNGSSEFIPLTEDKSEPEKTTESSSIPAPKPVERAEPPTKTKEPVSSIGKSKEDTAGVWKEPAKPQPVGRPEAAKQTAGVTSFIPESSLPAVSRAVDTESTYATPSNSNNISANGSNSEVQNQSQGAGQLSQPRSSGKDFPEYSIGFFATILHVITQFFRRWFTSAE